MEIGLKKLTNLYQLSVVSLKEACLDQYYVLYCCTAKLVKSNSFPLNVSKTKYSNNLNKQRRSTRERVEDYTRLLSYPGLSKFLDKVHLIFIQNIMEHYNVGVQILLLQFEWGQSQERVSIGEVAALQTGNSKQKLSLTNVNQTLQKDVSCTAGLSVCTNIIINLRLLNSFWKFYFFPT